MDIRPALSDAALRIRDSIDRFAKSKHWAREDFHLVMVANLVWVYFQVSLYAKEYDSTVPDENARYDEVYDFLEQDLKGEPSLYEATSVILWPLSCRHFVKQPPLGENYVQIDDSLLNSGWVEPQPMHRSSTG